MIHASSALRSYLAEHTAGEVKTWALNRLQGVDAMPMVYNGKEIEHPHEAVAAALGLAGDPLTPEKRAAILDAMGEIRQTVSTGFLRKAASPGQLELGKRWAEVVDRAKPAELAGEAESLLHACLYGRPLTQAVLPSVAAAASSYGSECALISPQLWTQLLDIRETAALAFRKLLKTTGFNEAARLWIRLFENKLAGDWPTNMRVLTVPLIKKASSPEEALEVLSAQLKDKPFAAKAKEELASSGNALVQALVKRLQVAARYSSTPGELRKRQRMLLERRKKVRQLIQDPQANPKVKAT
ncbi:MAG: hypothetical protein JWO94_3630 [Verrucomicrobiaceae bacterium]|nr:hypothetical protein [Verrucomicrobiaceae bacterium]